MLKFAPDMCQHCGLEPRIDTPSENVNVCRACYECGDTSTYTRIVSKKGRESLSAAHEQLAKIVKQLEQNGTSIMRVDPGLGKGGDLDGAEVIVPEYDDRGHVVSTRGLWAIVRLNGSGESVGVRVSDVIRL